MSIKAHLQRDTETSWFTGPISLLLKTVWKHCTHLRNYNYGVTRKTCCYFSSCQTMTSRGYSGENVQYWLAMYLWSTMHHLTSSEMLLSTICHILFWKTHQRNHTLWVLISTLKEYCKQIHNKCQRKNQQRTLILKNNNIVFFLNLSLLANNTYWFTNSVSFYDQCC